jgi:hypothetical protein
MTYVPNKNRIPTHEVNFSHQGLRFEERTRDRQWGRRKVRRGEGMKKEREDKEREGRGCPILHGNRAWMKELCRLTWCDSIDMAQHLLICLLRGLEPGRVVLVGAPIRPFFSRIGWLLRGGLLNVCGF